MTFKQSENRIVGVMMSGPGDGSIAYFPSTDSLAGALLFHLVDSALKRADLTNGENVWYGPTNDLRMWFTVADLPAALKCVHQALAESPAGALAGLWRIYWLDSAEAMWRGYNGAYDRPEADWDFTQAKIFHEAKQRELSFWVEHLKANLAKRKAE